MNAADRAWMQRILDAVVEVGDKLDQLLVRSPEVGAVYSNVPSEMFINRETGEILAPTPTGRRKRVTEVTEAFKQEMRNEFMGSLGGAQEVFEQMKLALAHQASTKYHDKQTYVRNWLKKAVAYQEAYAPQSTGTREQRQEAERSKHAADFERRESERY